jgi:glycosyltransferase involved in cell wall biosynthesis
MAGPELSVVIPTYNRREILLKTLAAYQQQSCSAEILEILVLDDESTDGTAEAVAEFSQRAVNHVRYFRLTHRGPAAARNHGIREARGKLLLFADDDIVPSLHLVAEHLAWHEKYPESFVAVLGLVEWAPEVKPTPFMEWLAKDGVLFAYAHLSPGESADFRYFYSCNLSLKTAFVRENGMFDEDFKEPAFEDTELSYRLQKRGLRALYNPAAVGYHHKFISFADACRRAKVVARARRVIETKEAGRFLAEVERGARQGAEPSRGIKRVVRNFLMPILPSLRPLLDSHIRLPKAIYGNLFYYYTKERPGLLGGPEKTGGTFT